MKKFKLQILKSTNGNKINKIIYFDIIARNEDEAIERFHIITENDPELTILNIKEINFDKPEYMYKYVKPVEEKITVVKSKIECYYCEGKLENRKPIIRSPKSSGGRIIINKDYNIVDMTTGVNYTNIPLSQCPKCNKKF